MIKYGELPLAVRVAVPIVAVGVAAGGLGAAVSALEGNPTAPKGAIVCALDKGSVFHRDNLKQTFNCPRGGIVVTFGAANDGKPEVTVTQKGKQVVDSELSANATEASVSIPRSRWQVGLLGINSTMLTWPVGAVYDAQTVYEQQAA